jgi:hypothetical protein
MENYRITTATPAVHARIVFVAMALSILVAWISIASHGAV